MATRENVTSASLKKCILAAKNMTADIKDLVRTVTIRESICSPYITGELIVLDNSNIIPNMAVEGGDLCDIAFEAPSTMGGGGSYAIDMYVLDIKAESSPENMMLKIYTISLVSSEYFTDRAKLTPDSTPVGMTGVAMVQKIWTDAGFKTPLNQPASDAPLRDGNQPLPIGLVKPFTAIGQVRDIQFYPSYPTGNVLLYRDKYKVNHVPLQYIYQTCTASRDQNSLVQKATWGIRFDHMFGADEAWRAMINLVEMSRSTMLDPTLYKTQCKRAFDQVAGKYGGSIFENVTATAGQNMAATNSDRTSPAIDYTNMIDRARWYALCLKSLPQYLARGPLQAGINMIVGTGVWLEMLPIQGSSSSNPNSGIYLITDLIHEVHNDLRVVNGTTTLQCLQKNSTCTV